MIFLKEYKLINCVLLVIIILILIGLILSASEHLKNGGYKTLVISNDVGVTNKSHLEILESLIVKNYEIIKKKIDFDKIYILSQTNDKSFKKYIESKYPNVSIINNKKNIRYDYYINATMYPEGKNQFHVYVNGKKIVKNLKLLNKKNNYYISHRVDKRFNNTNTFYLTPLCNSDNYIMADVLPFTENTKFIDYPVFLIIGRSTLRNNNILENILDKYDNYDKKFLIKYMTREAPKLKKKYNNLKICENYDFVNFHKEILDCHCMLMLISKKNQPGYFKIQLTSSINYILA